MKARPFTQGPGQRFFTANAGVTDALGRLQHLVTARDSIAVLTGGPGVGKSTLAEVALAAVTDPPLRVARVDLRYGDPEDIYCAIITALGDDAGEMRPTQALLALRRNLARLVRDEQRLVLCLDVGGISTEVARHLLRVTNLAGEHECQMNMILMGPHSLHQQVDVPALIQLRQRIGFRYRIRPFTLAETDRYIRHQVEAVDADVTTLLSTNVAAAVYCYVAGVPRLINTLMDAALSEACMQKVQRPDGNLIKRTAEGLGWKPMAPPQAGTDAGVKPAAQAARPAPLRSSPPKVTIVSSTSAPEAPRPTDMAPPPRTSGDGAMARSAGVGLAAEARKPAAAGGGLPAPVMPMDEMDTSATGMLRLQDLDARFAENIFGKDAEEAAAKRDAD